MKKVLLTFFTLMLFTLCLTFDTQGAMADSELKGRLSAYSDFYVKTDKGVAYYEYEKWDASEEEMYAVISGMAESLMGQAVEDYCRVNVKFFFTHGPYGDDYESFYDGLCLVKDKFGSFFTEWSRYNKLLVGIVSHSGGDYFSANFKLYLNGNETGDIQSKYANPYFPLVTMKTFKFRGEEYNERVLSVVNQAQQECEDDMEKVQFFLRCIDENAVYDINTGTSNDPALALLMGRTVCGGYANAFKDLCNAAGIPAIVPVNMEANHAWSQVYVNGIWYTADLCDVVKSKSGTYEGYLFTDPDLSADYSDFVEKHKKAYVESFKYKDTVNLNSCSFSYDNSHSYTGKGIKPSVTVKFGGKALKAGTDYKVTYSNNIYPGTAKITVEAIKDSGYAGKKTLTFKINLPKIKLTAKPGKNSVSLSWKAVSGVDGYIVRMYNYKTDEYEDLSKVKGTSCTVKNLSAGKKYKLAVIPYVSENGNIYRGNNSPVTLHTLPGKVKNLRATSVTESSVKLKWTAMDAADEYEVQISTDGKRWKTQAKVKKNSLTVKKLSANKKYYFRVRAVTEKGKGSYSSKRAVTTLMARPTVKGTAVKGNITVSWNRISGAKGYVVAYARNSDMINNKKLTVKKGSKTSATLKGLKSKKNYYIRVRAYKTVSGERVYGSYSKVIKVKAK